VKRLLALALFVTVVGCRLPEEREGLKPLPEKGTVLPYQDMFNRAKAQAGAARDAFYVDNWLEIEQMAQVLEQTARHLPNSSEQPNNVKKTLAKEAESLRTQAFSLREAAKSKNVQTANETLRQIDLTIRGLRPTE
jgi:hypothetical protein